MGEHFNAKHDDGTWRGLFERWHGGETARALRAEAGVSHDTWSANAKRLGMRRQDLPEGHPARRGAPAFRDRADDYRHPNSLLTEGEWRTLFAMRAEGVPDTALGAKFGVHAATICSQAKARGLSRPACFPGGYRASRYLSADSSGYRASRCLSPETPGVRQPSGDEAGTEAEGRSHPVAEGDPPPHRGEGELAGVEIVMGDAGRTMASFDGAIAALGRQAKFAQVAEACAAKLSVKRAMFSPSPSWGGVATRSGDGVGSGGGVAHPDALMGVVPPDGREGESWAEPELRAAQRAPEGDWTTWLFLGGRGAGKTLAGAVWLADQAQALGERGRLALIGPTLHDVREVMIEGASGVMSLARWNDPKWAGRRPVFEASRRRLVFPNGATAYAFSAEDPDSLRGPQFSAAWADEFCAWRGGGDTLALMRMGLRLPGPPFPLVGGRVGVGGEGEVVGQKAREAGSGDDASCALPLELERAPLPQPFPVEGKGVARFPPRLMISTTPRPTMALRRLRAEAGCVETHAGTRDNAANLSAGFLDGLERLYGGTRRAAQELEGRVVDLDGALFTAEMIARARAHPAGDYRPSGYLSADSSGYRASRCLSPEPPGDGQPSGGEIPDRFDRVVVAVDPTATAGGNACGIVVAARSRLRGNDDDSIAFVLADRSVSGVGPDAWARRAARAVDDFGAACIVAEVNQGGDMVKAVLKAVGCAVEVKEVRASKGKRVRAEPVAALYEQGRVRHVEARDGELAALEEELMALGSEDAGAGNDRADALVWALTELMIDGPRGETGPRIRALDWNVPRSGLTAGWR